MEQHLVLSLWVTPMELVDLIRLVSTKLISISIAIFWVSPVAQLVKNLPAMRETWVRSLGWEEPLEESMATHSYILSWRIPMNRGDWWATV